MDPRHLLVPLNIYLLYEGMLLDPWKDSTIICKHFVTNHNTKQQFGIVIT